MLSLYYNQQHNKYNNIIMEETIEKHIGIQPKFLCKEVYHTLYCPLMPNQNKHLIINHGEDLLIYDAGVRKIVKYKNNNNSNITSDPIIKALYSSRYRAIFLMRKSQLLDVYSEDLIQLKTQLDIKDVRHCLDWEFLENQSAFLVLTSDTLKIVYLQINCNHLKSLFKNNYEFNCREIGFYDLPPTYFQQFSNQITVCGKYILLASSENVKIIDFYRDPAIPASYSEIGSLKTTGRKDSKTVLSITGICSSPEQITVCYYEQKLSLLICGTIYGKILLYKINFRNIMATMIPTEIVTRIHINHKIPKSQKSIEQVNQGGQRRNWLTKILAKNYFTFKIDVHNFKQINHIRFHSQKIIFTAGSDDYLQVISLEHMASIERFRLSSKISQKDFMFLSKNQYLAVTSDSGFEKNLYSYLLCLDYKMKWHHKSTIIQSIYNQSNVITVMTDNSLNWINCDQNQNAMSQQKQRQVRSSKAISKNKSDQKNKPSQIVQAFVPKSCKTILCIDKNPFTSSNYVQEYWLLTNQGEIHKYKIKLPTSKKGHTKIEQKEDQPIKLKSFIDIYNHQTNEKVLLFKFIDLVPIKYDSDIKQKKYKPNLQKAADVRPIAFGCQTGQILICPTFTPNNLQNQNCICNIIMRIRSFGESVYSFSFNDIYSGQNGYAIDLNTISLISETNENVQDSLRASQIERQQFKRDTKLLISCSLNQIVFTTVSNYQPPNTLFKTLIHSPSSFISSQTFFQRSLSKYYTGIVSNNSANIVFAYYSEALVPNSQVGRYPPQLCLFSNNSIIHETAITSLEHSEGVSFISGDETGKIAIWTLYSEVIAILQVNSNVKIECCYYFKNLNKIFFGYLGKLFQSPLQRGKLSKNMKKSDRDEEDQALQEILRNDLWMRESVKILKKGGRVGSQQTGLSIISQLMQKARQENKQDQKIKNESLNMTPKHKKYKTIQKYQTIQKSQTVHFPKLAKHQALTSRRSTHDEIRKTAISKIKQHKALMENNSEILFQPYGNSLTLTEDVDPESNRAHWSNSQRVKKGNSKSRNKVYEYLFHFPSAGLYQQLVHKNMLE